MIKLSSIKKDHQESKTLYIDLNSDLGEGFGIYQNTMEQDITDYVSSINIPCGSHAGDPLKILQAIQIAKQKRLAIGAHIGYPDISGFGYREMNLSFEELQALILFQVGALKSIAEANNMQIDYVRPHGAMYIQMSKDPVLAISIAKSLETIDTWLILVGPPGESLKSVAEETKIRIAPEIIIDKYYDEKGNLLFNEPNITNVDEVLANANRLVAQNKLLTQNDAIIDVDFKTIHLSSSNKNALEIAKAVRQLFVEKPCPIAVSLVGDNSII